MKRTQFYSRLSLVLVLLFCFTGFTAGQVAFASKALPPQVKILLGFKERYGADNKLHYGIDVYAEKGTELYAPVEGTVSFVGRVPGSAGLNVTALTITTDVGHQISINPFATTKVKVGDGVKKGQVLGTVSDVGDPSSAESHFHLSLREKGVYKDPTHLLMETISVAAESGGAGNNTVAATIPPANNPPANPSTAPAQSPANQSQTQAQKAETKAGKATSAQATTKPATTADKNAVAGEKKSFTTAPATSTQATLAGGQKQGQSVANESKKPTSSLVDGESATREGNSAKKVANNTSSSGAVEGANSAWKQGLMGEPVPKSSVAHFESRQAAALNTSSQNTILQLGQASASSLRAELVAYFSEMNQVQLTTVLFVGGILLSCTGVGVWRVMQMVGFDSALLNFRKNLSVAVKVESSEGGES